MTGAFLKFDRATLPFLKIVMRNRDPPVKGPKSSLQDSKTAESLTFTPGMSGTPLPHSDV